VTEYLFSTKELADLAAGLERAVASLFADLQKRTSDPMVTKVLSFIENQEKSHAVTFVALGGAYGKDAPAHEYESDMRDHLLERMKAVRTLQADIAANPKRALEKILAAVSDAKGKNITVLRRMSEGYPKELAAMIEGVVSEEKKHLLMMENIRRRLTLPDPMSLLEE
jgi:rubrerythrin